LVVAVFSAEPWASLPVLALLFSVAASLLAALIPTGPVYLGGRGSAPASR
jgi:hypothetical protein